MAELPAQEAALSLGCGVEALALVCAAVLFFHQPHVLARLTCLALAVLVPVGLAMARARARATLLCLGWCVLLGASVALG